MKRSPNWNDGRRTQRRERGWSRIALIKQGTYMDLNKYTEKAREAVIAAQELAEQLNHAQIEPEHLLATLVEQADGVVPAVLRKLDVDPTGVARSLRGELDRIPKAYGGSQPGLSPRLRSVADKAQGEAGRL